jgi:hypothetical protein
MSRHCGIATRLEIVPPIDDIPDPRPGRELPG